MRIQEGHIPHIEKAVGFELYDMQKQYLLRKAPMGNDRRSGRTTAYCILIALSDGDELDLKRPEEFSDGWELSNHIPYARGFFRSEFMRIYNKLKDYGFPVRPVRK